MEREREQEREKEREEQGRAHERTYATLRITRLRRAGTTLLAAISVAIPAFVGCSFHNAGTGLVDVDGGGPSGTSPTSTTTNTSTGAPTNPSTTGTPTSPSSTTSSTGSSSSGTCPPPTVASSNFPGPWKFPTQMMGACSATDINNINAAVSRSGATFTALYTALNGSPACQACVFSDQSSGSWQPIVWLPDMATSGGNAIQNFGACYAVAPGGSFACGSSEQSFEFCADTACPSTCSNASACITAAESGACKSEVTLASASCGSAFASLNTACATFSDEVTIVCGP